MKVERLKVWLCGIVVCCSGDVGEICFENGVKNASQTGCENVIGAFDGKEVGKRNAALQACRCRLQGGE